GAADASDLQRGLRLTRLEGADAQCGHQNLVQPGLYRDLCLWPLVLYREPALEEEREGDRASAANGTMARLPPRSSSGLPQLGGVREESPPAPAELESRHEPGCGA